ncbi:hypothetical protein B0H17DRAFT_85086 [Mycena rosella]|uniref:DUF6533 domain-containing protein n=1 Tax=Mycena rosella TaxID=1033263 RepID=A0AAD7GQD2_MYCRO|nr:hypothetical protein B0H17DRAFT_85086 [Mycena rosella]
MHVGLLGLASYAGLTFATCEIIMTLKTELRYIWIDLHRFTLVKLMYLVSRYLGLAVHITNTVLVTLVQRYTIIPVRLCRIALIYQAVVIIVMLGILDAILMIRVYALYNRKKSIAVLCAFLLVLKMVAFIPSAFLGFPEQRFGPTCLVTTGSQTSLFLFGALYRGESFSICEPLFFRAGEVVVQLVILALTLFRHFSATRRGWGNRLFRLSTRDGSMVFAATTVGMVGTTVAGLRPAHVTHFIFP